MMILVDTHILIWDAIAPNRLSDLAAQALARANQQDGILISDISLWEIAMLVEKKRVQIETDCQTFLTLILQANNCHVRPITPQIATLSVRFPAEVTQDPADRLILATAVAEDVPLVTADQNLQKTDHIPIIW